jgi:ATP-dependent DNA helicase RecG
MTVEELVHLREAEDKIEFKEAKHNYPFSGGSHREQADRRKCFLGYVVALSNERGGRLVLGMTDKIPRDVVGTDFGDGKIGALEDETYKRLGIRIHIEELAHPDGRVLVVIVPSRPIGRLMKFEGVPLMRTGESLRNMTDEEMLGILLENEPDFSAQICSGLRLEDLDGVAIDKMKDAYSRKQQNSGFKALSTEQVLSDLKLLAEGKLNYAALLLVGKREAIERFLPHAKIIWEFRYTTGQIAYDFRETTLDPLFLEIDAIWTLINRQNAAIPIQTGAYIFSTPTFNEAVIREAVLNAVAHRDYTINSEVVIKQFPKAISITNPGGFPKGVNLDNLLTVNSTPRSRLMAEIMEKTGLVERSGQGVDKIFSITLSEGKSAPNYADSDAFQVALKLGGMVVERAFSIFVAGLQEGRGESKLGVEQIIGLYQVKQGRFGQVKTSILAELEKEKIIVSTSGASNRYTLADPYSTLAAIEQRIATRYVVAEVDQFLLAIQGKLLKISELETQLAGALSRNQIRFLTEKLLEDKIIEKEGVKRGTRYRLNEPFQSQHGEALTNDVLLRLRELHQGDK